MEVGSEAYVFVYIAMSLFWGQKHEIAWNAYKLLKSTPEILKCSFFEANITVLNTSLILCSEILIEMLTIFVSFKMQFHLFVFEFNEFLLSLKEFLDFN